MKRILNTLMVLMMLVISDSCVIPEMFRIGETDRWVRISFDKEDLSPEYCLAGFYDTSLDYMAEGIRAKDTLVSLDDRYNLLVAFRSAPGVFHDRNSDVPAIGFVQDDFTELKFYTGSGIPDVNDSYMEQVNMYNSVLSKKISVFISFEGLEDRFPGKVHCRMSGLADAMELATGSLFRRAADKISISSHDMSQTDYKWNVRIPGFNLSDNAALAVDFTEEDGNIRSFFIDLSQTASELAGKSYAYVTVNPLFRAVDGTDGRISLEYVKTDIIIRDLDIPLEFGTEGSDIEDIDAGLYVSELKGDGSQIPIVENAEFHLSGGETSMNDTVYLSSYMDYDIRSYSPYVESAEKSGIRFLHGDDVLYSQVKIYNASRINHCAVLDYVHKTARIVFDVVDEVPENPDTQAGMIPGKGSSLIIRGFYKTALLDISSGTLETEDKIPGGEQIFDSEYDASTGKWSLDGSTCFFTHGRQRLEMEFVHDGISLKTAVEEEFEAGFTYRYRIKVGADRISLDAVVCPWEESDTDTEIDVK